MNKLSILLIDINSRSRRDRISLSVSVRLSGILKYLSDSGEINFVTINENQITSLSSIDWADIIFIGNGRYVTKNIINLVTQAKIKNKKVLCDIDDYTLSLPSYTSHTKAQSTDSITYLFQLVDCITVANSHLKTHIEELGFNSVVLPNCIYCDHFELFRKKLSPDRNRIAFINTDLIKMIQGKDGFLSAINRFMEENKNLEIDYFGDPFPEFFSLKNIHFNDRMPYEAMMKILLNGNYLFAVVPLGGNEEDALTKSFHSYKNPFKYINYGLAEIPGIYSDSFIYNQVINCGWNGLIAQNSYDGWYGALNNMIGDENLRTRISYNALHDIRGNFNVHNAATILMNELI